MSNDDAIHLSWYFKVINNLMRAQMDDKLRGEDLTKVQFDVLLYVSRCNRAGSKVIQRDLENHFQISNPSVSNMISRLEYKGLIERVSDEKDRRRRYVVLTDKTLRLLAETHQALQEFDEKMLEGFTPEELEEGIRFLQRILMNLNGKEGMEFDFNTCEADQAV